MHTPPAKGANLLAEPQINKPRTQPRQVPANRTIKTESCKGPAEQVCRCTNSAIIAIDAPTLIRCFTARAAMPSVVDKAGPPLGPNLQYQKRQPYRVTRGRWLCSYSSQRACVCLMVDRADAVHLHSTAPDPVPLPDTSTANPRAVIAFVQLAGFPQPQGVDETSPSILGDQWHGGLVDVDATRQWCIAPRVMEDVVVALRWHSCATMRFMRYTCLHAAKAITNHFSNDSSATAISS